MPVALRPLLALLLFAATAAPAHATPVCRFVSGGRGMQLTVALEGSAGLVLEVEWGDGAFSSTRMALHSGRGKAFLRHRYAAEGVYEVRARALMPGAGVACGGDLVVDTPFEMPVSAAALRVMPDDSAPDSSDLVGDAELGPALAEAPGPGGFVQRPDPAEAAEPSQPVIPRVVEAVRGAVGGAVRGFLDLLFGR